MHCICYKNGMVLKWKRPTKQKTNFQNRHTKKIQSGLECSLQWVMGSCTAVWRFHFLFWSVLFLLLSEKDRLLRVCERVWVRRLKHMCFIFFYCFVHNRHILCTVAATILTHESSKRQSTCRRRPSNAMTKTFFLLFDFFFPFHFFPCVFVLVFTLKTNKIPADSF